MISFIVIVSDLMQKTSRSVEQKPFGSQAYISVRGLNPAKSEVKQNPLPTLQSNCLSSSSVGWTFFLDFLCQRRVDEFA